VTEYLVVYEKSATGWGAYVPDLPGLGVTGGTLEETHRLIEEGLALHLQALKAKGQPIPRPTATSEKIAIDAELLA
jgi:predicted RNase H-like HicB family nuclease